MLGIVFGVSSVIAMLAVGEGASFEAQEQIRRQGSQNIILHSVKPPEDDMSSQGRSYMVEYGITAEDLQRIRETIPTIGIIVPGRIIRKKIWNGGNRLDCDLVGTVPWYPEMRNHPVASGRFFTENDMEARAHVCVLGADVVGAVFPLSAAIGKKVRIEGDYYVVIGIMEALAEGGAAGEGSAAGVAASARRVYIPLTAAADQFGEILVKRSSGSTEVERVEFHEVIIKVDRIEKVEDTALVIEDLLKRFHKKDDFAIVVPLELLRAAEETTRIFNVVLGAIAAISLIVVMNIMLASVTERTREIGIRRALGAKRKDIVTQFLVETVILSGSGGMIGVAAGMAVPRLITYFSDMVTIVTPWSPVIAFGISALVGVVFGLYPALRAADMDPVEALRHE